MKKINISSQWRYHNGKDLITIDLPHDNCMENEIDCNSAGGINTGFAVGYEKGYTKYMKFGSMDHYILHIDGAYMCARIYFNDNLLDMHPHGYTPYLVDLSKRVRKEHNNKIKIITQYPQPSSRWYSGSGIYRDVYLWSGGRIRIEPWDLFITTLSLSEREAKLNADLTVSADFDTNCEIRFKVTSPKGESALEFSENLTVKEGKNNFQIPFAVENPLVWDIDTPELYKINAEIYVNGELEDSFENTFGIRTIAATVKDGLLINGKSVKLRGGCIHHDNGGLGAAEFPYAVERKLKLLKSVGYNAVRTAHNPPSLTLLELCDRLGLFVMDEAFDMWNVPKNRYDYSLWFRDWYARDIALMVRRDRNHPCVISYSIGNEINERHCTSDGAEWSEILSSEIRKYDTTRLVTSALCELDIWCDGYAPEDYKEDFVKFNKLSYEDRGDGTPESSFDARTFNYAKPLDIVGYNYLHFRYDYDCEKYPDRIIWGSETKALEFYDSWSGVMRHPNIIGDFTWTAFDNLGEAGAGRFVWEREGVLKGYSVASYPWRACYQGDFGLAGYRRPQSYFRETFWKETCEPRIFTIHPEHNGEGFSGTGWHWYDVKEQWTFEDKYLNTPVTTQVYTNAQEIAFILNDREIARVKPEKHIATAQIPYEKGKLTAVSYKNGIEESRFTLETVNEPEKLILTPERNEISADGLDLAYIQINITDAQNRRVVDCETPLECKIEGANLRAFYSENPKTEDNYLSGKCHSFDGRAILIISSKQSGTARIEITSEKFGSAACEIKLTKNHRLIGQTN